MKRSAAIALQSGTKRARPAALPITVMATHVHNYMIADPLVDWIKNQNRRGTRSNPVFSKSNEFTNFLMERGREFETKLVEYINQNKMSIQKVSDTFSKEGCEKTRQLMVDGIPLLHSAPVFNEKEQTGGIIDLLVRSDYIHHFVSENPLAHDEIVIPAPKLNRTKPYHYVVIDIKFSTLPLKADGKFLLNSGHYPAHKAQLWIYTQAIGELQGYTPRYGFILGRRWRFTKESVTRTGFDCLDKMGVVDFQGVDKSYIEKTKEAIQWVRDVREHGSEWSVNPPSRPELYPNMCVDSGSWNAEKRKIADMIGEITSVWYCGVKHRENAIEEGVTSWRDVDCTSETIGMSGSRASIVDKILDINRQKKDKLRPKTIESDLLEWRDTSAKEVFVDFETLSDIFSDFDSLPMQASTDMIFMIGVGWEESGKWVYKSFTCSSATKDEEYRIMDEFNTLMASMKFPKMWCWHAEPGFWDRAENRQFDRVADENEELKDHISDDWNVSDWADLAKLFREEPIVIKDCFKFGLKEVVAAMHKHKLIKAELNTSCTSGMAAMVNAWKCYNTSDDPVSSPVMKDITKYNEWDCKVLWKILSYLRANH